MQTRIHQKFNAIPVVEEAESILRACVHCGFCTATCPTYQELCDERDGPRGRIYLIKQFLETGTLTEASRKHLDRCLSCRSCETTCPSGVQYARLLDIGRSLAEQQLPRSPGNRLLRWGLRQVIPHPARFKALLALARGFQPLLPEKLQQKIPPQRHASAWPNPNGNNHKRVMLTLAGCVQPSTAPNTNAAAARVLDRLGITLVEVPKASCCGAVSQHLSADDEALDFMRNNIDAWWPAIEEGIEAIVMTASGCGVTVQEYGHLLKDDSQYAEKARLVSELCKDLSEVLLEEDLSQLNSSTSTTPATRTAVHCPCSLQHGLKQNDSVEQILQKVGIPLTKTKDKHLCCGSAGTYSILQPELSQKLLVNKLEALTLEQPKQIVTANIGCQLHLESQANVPVKHWIELLDQAL